MRISIVTPSFNQGKYIERTLLSVLSQSIPDLEYIVMDGGSSDETVDILKKYSSQLTFISEKDRGQAHAVNKGLQMTRGEIIGWLNSDDIYYPDALKTVLDFFEKNPEIDIVYGKANHIDQNDLVLEAYPTQKWNLKKFRQTCFISQPAVFFRRRVIEQYGLLNEDLNFCMDYEYWLRTALYGARFFYLEKILAGSRLYPETKTLSAPMRANQEAMEMLKEKFGMVPARWLLNEAVMKTREKTSCRLPNPRYLIQVLKNMFISAIYWNGFFKGLRSCLLLPFI